MVLCEMWLIISSAHSGYSRCLLSVLLVITALLIIDTCLLSVEGPQAGILRETRLTGRREHNPWLKRPLFVSIQRLHQIFIAHSRLIPVARVD